MRVRQTYWSPIGWLDKLTTIYLPWDSLALVGAAAIIGWGNKLFSILLLVVKSLSCGTTLILLFSWLNNYLDYLSIGPNSVSFILAICTVKDWDQTTGIVGVSLTFAFTTRLEFLIVNLLGWTPSSYPRWTTSKGIHTPSRARRVGCALILRTRMRLV